MTSATSTVDRPQSGTEAFAQLSDAVKEYLVAVGSELISRVGDKVQEATEKVAERGPHEVGVAGQSGIAGALALAEGKSKAQAAWAAFMAGVRAKLHTMFGPDVSGGQKALNVLKLVLFVLAAIVALLLLAVLLPVVVVVLIIVGSR